VEFGNEEPRVRVKSAGRDERRRHGDQEHHNDLDRRGGRSRRGPAYAVRPAEEAAGPQMHGARNRKVTGGGEGEGGADGEDGGDQDQVLDDDGEVDREADGAAGHEEEEARGDEEGGADGHRRGHPGEEVRGRRGSGTATARAGLADEARQQHGAEKRGGEKADDDDADGEVHGGADPPRELEQEAQCVGAAQRTGAEGEHNGLRNKTRTRHGRSEIKTQKVSRSTIE